MPADTDLVILGGGCAGLSLATRLAALGSRSPRTLILESRSVYADDRTWCFWDRASTPWHHLVRHRWRSMTVRTAERSFTADCGATPYQMLTARSFYDAALDTLERTERIDLVTGTAVLAEPRKIGGRWRVETSAGPCQARMVIDTRPEHGAALLWQSFYGHEIECDTAIFDPDRIDLMDFAQDDPAKILFTYVLPVSRTRALVEVTVFGPDPLDPDALAGDLDAAIARRADGAAFSIVRSEHGILPMGLAPIRAQSDVTLVRAGLTAGAARPSTGYAFQRIQRWAEACAGALRDGAPPLAHAADTPLVWAMDHLLLAVIRARPDMAPSLFLSLFEKADTARIIRFLSDRGTLADHAAIVWALPAIPFLRQVPGALRAMRRR
jgi:lycopene beta-cyclase